MRVEVPTRVSGEAESLLKPWIGRDVRSSEDYVKVWELIQKLTALDERVAVHPDAEEILSHGLHRHRVASLVSEIRKAPSKHPLRRALLKTELLPYQLDGIAFAVGAGRSVLADEMGLGKTIQGVGVAELLARQTGIERVLVICPASLKSQWRIEIQRFCERSVQLVAGPAAEREQQYRGGAFFTVCNYEQVLRDYLSIERTKWDLIILDEAQRIKNWEAKTSRIIKGLRSPFALVLTGTPLENRLDDLYSVVEFIDDRRLGPAYRFFHQHRVADEKGRVRGYKNLDALREQLKPVLLRRTRVSVQLEVPSRSTEIVRIPPTDEQLELHVANMRVVSSIIRKSYISEMDLLRLRRALMAARMSADSTFLVDKQPPGYSTKLARLAELLESLLAEADRKILIFSEWTTMLNLIEPLLKALQVQYVRLDGSVPQKARQQLVATFQKDPECRVFLTSNAGSTGLNLQAANTVINVDLPWNPALLEQRIGRAHRMGQKRKVQVYLMITEGTIEENLLVTLAAKHELAAAVLDPDSDLNEVQLISGVEELKRRLEVLIGAVPDASRDVSMQEQVEKAVGGVGQDNETEPALVANKEQLAEAAGQMLAGALSLVGGLLPASAGEGDAKVAGAIAIALKQSAEVTESGQHRIMMTLPDAAAIEGLAAVVARLMSLGRTG